MELSKYNGNIHPEEWINDLQTFFNVKQNSIVSININIVISLIDSAIKLPTGIDNFEKLCDALKEDISFKIFKNTNKRKLQSLRYIPERLGGDTSKFIIIFRKLCYNAEINDIEEQKKCLYKTLPNDHLDYISNEFYKKMKDVNSTNELAKEFEDIVLEESRLIRNESIIALKHVVTGKYLSSIENLCYTTGSKSQMVFAGSSEPDPNSLWRIQFSEELATYTDTSITLQHVKSNMCLGLNDYSESRYDNINWRYRTHFHYHKSPSKFTEVSCGGSERKWRFNHSKENYQGYLKSNDIVNISIKKSHDNNGPTQNGLVEFLRSHDIQFTIGSESFQEVICHEEGLGKNDAWCIELIHEVKIF